MIPPHKLIGLPYRLGADPVQHRAADCLSVSRAVLAWHGISSPAPHRNWYRRLRQKDYSIFEEELASWGKLTNEARLGVIGLVRNPDDTCGLAAFYEDGWLHCNHSQVITWTPPTLLIPAALYCQQK